jgi:hypothetical protein
MSRAAQRTLDAGDYDVEADDLEAEEWRDIFDRYDGDVEAVASHLEIDRSAALAGLIEAGIYDFETLPIREYEALTPEDVGLSPLNCVRCGELEIGDHECPVCGFDPEDEAGNFCDVCGRRYATFESQTQAFCDKHHETGEREWTNPIDETRYLVTAWRMIDGRLIPLEREAINDAE